jgi:ABC-2 type transport system ATP-binding protein
MSVIETDGLTKRFGEDVLAVDDLDLRVEAGEVFGFLGPNGAGKSTTINVLLDLTRPTAGSATVLGHDIQEESQAIRERIGVLPEGYDLYDRLSGRKHVEFAMRTKGVDGDPAAVLDRVGLDEDDWDRTVGGYSKGMKQRLALGMALTGDPELLILDEPSSGLDPTGIAEVKELVRSEAERGTAVFFSSHILSEVEAVCDRIGVLNEGRLVASGTIDDLQREFAGDARLDLALDPVPETGIEALPEVDGVTGTAVHEEGVTVQCRESRAKARAINHLEDAGATVTDIQVEDHSLEDIFAALTGNGEDAGGSGQCQDGVGQLQDGSGTDAPTGAATEVET